jgi:hypothetical protein
MFGALRAFDIKLKLLLKHTKSVSMCRFSPCDLLRKDGAVRFPFKASVL